MVNLVIIITCVHSGLPGVVDACMALFYGASGD
jgi:hypothetical protein